MWGNVGRAEHATYSISIIIEKPCEPILLHIYTYPLSCLVLENEKTQTFKSQISNLFERMNLIPSFSMQARSTGYYIQDRGLRTPSAGFRSGPQCLLFVFSARHWCCFPCMHTSQPNLESLGHHHLRCVSRLPPLVLRDPRFIRPHQVKRTVRAQT